MIPLRVTQAKTANKKVGRLRTGKYGMQAADG